MTEYRIDLLRAKESEYAEYMFRLTFALNDLLSVRQLLDLLPAEESNETLVLRSYLIRMCIAHLAEAANAFVTKIIPKGKKKGAQHPVFDFLNSQPNSASTFETFQKIVDSPDFSKLKALRNTFFFHYNHSDQGSQTKKAIDVLVERATKCPSGTENLIVRTSDPVTTRFYIGDELMIAGWRMLCNAKPCPEVVDPEMEDHRKIFGDSMLSFIEFAEAAILDWIVVNKLQHKN